MPDLQSCCEQQYHQIKAVLARLGMDSSAKVDFLVDRDGQEIASQGEGGRKMVTRNPRVLTQPVWFHSGPVTSPRREAWLG